MLHEVNVEQKYQGCTVPGHRNSSLTQTSCQCCVLILKHHRGIIQEENVSSIPPHAQRGLGERLDIGRISKIKC